MFGTYIGGENASSLAIESALFEHPDILEVAVVARPHEEYGERAMAYVILRDNCKDKWEGKGEEFVKELKEFSRSRLPGMFTVSFDPRRHFLRSVIVLLADILIGFIRLCKTSLGRSRRRPAKDFYRQNPKAW